MSRRKTTRTMADWLEHLPATGWRLNKERSTKDEVHGAPCPGCGYGTEDGFWLNAKGRIGCRGCDPGRRNPTAYRRIVEAVFGPHRGRAPHPHPRFGRKPTASPPAVVKAVRPQVLGDLRGRAVEPSTIRGRPPVVALEASTLRPRRTGPRP